MKRHWTDYPRTGGSSGSALSRRMFLQSGVALGAAAAMTTHAPDIAAASTPSTPSPSEMSLTDVLGTYDAAIREQEARADGVHHIDTDATIDQVAALNINTYAFLLWGTPSDWDDLCNEFMPAAQEAGLSVWVWLTPPTEGPSEPFGDDYVAWGTAIGTLAAQYPNLTAWGIDDFANGQNLTTFTPQYIDSMQSAARAQSPTLELFATTYWQILSGGFVSTYSGHLDGVVYPYLDGPSDDTIETAGLDDQLTGLWATLSAASMRLYLMPYVRPIFKLDLWRPTPDYVSAIIETGLSHMASGTLSGVMAYATPLQFAQETCDPQANNATLGLTAPWFTPTTAGDYAEAAQTIAPDPEAQSYGISFIETDLYKSVPEVMGYYLKQLLVDGEVAWQEDIAGPTGHTWTSQTVDLTNLLTEKQTATIAFRIYNATAVSNFGTWFIVSQAVGTGFALENGDFSSSSGWTLTQSGTGFRASLVPAPGCNPDRQQDCYLAIQQAYGPSLLVYWAESADLPRDRVIRLVAQGRRILALRQAGDFTAARAAVKVFADLARDFGQELLAERALAVRSQM